ncbi:PHD-zinc-finger like domain-containing protein [Fomitopsis betulina]|nr:PHD-zinc-finger like domain-containing protein [Fomitopsis betulina]
MGRGVSPGPSPLPKVSFAKVQDDFASYPSGVHDQQMRSFGYNDFSEFKRPVHYIRYIEPLESELSEQVEYDMDEQDQEWLNTVNAERKKENQGAVSYELFEIIMDRLEKEWFDLTKNIPKPDLALPSEDSTCAICDDSEGENTNAIVFCDGCNLAVHQDCYGVPYIPEGQWLCRKCTVSPENPVSCVLCPNEGGAFKQTVHGDWVHLLCAIWVPETRVANDVFMEPITGIDRISKQRWRLKCSLCEVKDGACIQCNKPSCFVAFHVTCARKEKLLMPMKASQGSEAPMLAAFCEKHLPQEQQDARVVALEAERAEAEMCDNTNPSPKSNKTARAYAKTYKPGPPLVPRIILERILHYISKVAVRHKREFVVLVCRYWSLKREARRGAAFLKRLHLEPWTANAGSQQHTDEEKAIKLECMKRLRRDLESIRMIAEMCRKRESMKLDRVEAIQYVFDKLLLAHEPVLRHAFERISAADRMDIFREPVSLQEVPDYLDIVERPMCWRVIDEKLSGHQYLDLQDFKDDIKLVATNAMLYNMPGTAYHKTAQKVLGAAEPIMAELDKLIARLPSNANVANEARGPDVMDEDDDGPPPSPPRPLIGDLEPPVELLDLLLSEDAIKDDIDFILDKPSLDALFSYELAKEKPTLPTPEANPPKVKLTRTELLERKRQERLEAARGFRDLRSRRSSASLAQSESGPPEPPVEDSQPESGPSTQATEPEPSQDGVTETPMKAKRKQHVIAEPGKLAAEMVEEVDNQQSFKMFNEGWILPPDHVRGGRQRPAPQPTPSKKKGRGGKTDVNLYGQVLSPRRIARGKSHLAESAPIEEAAEVVASGEDAMEVDDIVPTEDHPMRTEGQPAVDQCEEESSDDEPPRIIIIEHLDTPAIRHEKYLQKRLERQRKLAEAEAAERAARGQAGDEAKSDLSDLSDLSDAGEASAAGVAEEEVEEEPGTFALGEGEYLEGGTLGALLLYSSVNRQSDHLAIFSVGQGSGLLDTFPWWPAVVFEADDVTIPKRITDWWTKMEDGANGLHIVRFFDSKNTWQCLTLDKMRMLGENHELDQDMLANVSRLQKWKSPKMRQQCREAFRCVGFFSLLLPLI